MDTPTWLADAALDLIASECVNGFVDVYGHKLTDDSSLGAPPADSDTAITTQTRLTYHTLAATPFGASALRQAIANAITADAVTTGGYARFLRVMQADHTTVVAQILVGGCTMTTAASATWNAVTLQVTSLAAPVFNGDRVLFGGNKIVTIGADAAASNTAVNLTVAALTDAINAGVVGTYGIIWTSALLPLGAVDSVRQLILTFPRSY